MFTASAKILYGIYEESNCAHNLITSNNINWVVNEGIKSLGKNTLVANNLTVADVNHHKPFPGRYQIFDVKILDELIDQMQKFMID